jgi:hypothetical protein
MMLAQGVATGLRGSLALLGAVAVGLGWRVPALRHGVASLAAGGLGMVAGGALDQAIWGGTSCHGDPVGFAGIGFGTVGMVGLCTGACVAACGAGGRRALDPGFHLVALAGMLCGEQAAGAAARLAGVEVGHWVLAVGMGVGTATGASVAGLLRSQAREPRRAGADVGERVAIELGQHRVLAGAEHLRQRAAGEQPARGRLVAEALRQVEVRLQRAHDRPDPDLGRRTGEGHASAAPAERLDEAG